MIARVSSRGQITLPAAARRTLGIAPGSDLEIIVGDDAITLRPLRRVANLAGILHEYADPGAAEDWDVIREETEKAVARETVRAGARHR